MKKVSIICVGAALFLQACAVPTASTTTAAASQSTSSQTASNSAGQRKVIQLISTKKSEETIAEDFNRQISDGTLDTKAREVCGGDYKIDSIDENFRYWYRAVSENAPSRTISHGTTKAFVICQ